MTAQTFVADALRSHDFALQKYMLLHSQHEELTQHLDQIRPPRTSSTPSVSPYSSPATSPSFSPSPRRHRSSRGVPGGGGGDGRRVSPSSSSGSLSARSRLNSSSSLDTVWDEDTMFEVAAEEQRLFDVNEGIKRALTELLNSEKVRQDRSFRMWVQCRLMETEKELRSGRRRRSNDSGH